MTSSEKQSWEQIRARGHGRFILRRGLLRWGIPFGLAVTVGPFLYDAFTHAGTASVRTLVVSFVFSTLAIGMGMGETAWRRREREYYADHSG